MALQLNNNIDEVKTIKSYNVVSVVQSDDPVEAVQSIVIYYREQYTDDSYGDKKSISLVGAELGAWLSDSGNGAFYVDAKQRSYQLLMDSLGIDGNIV